MNASPAVLIARMCCLTVIILSLLGTILTLAFYRPDSAPLFGLATAVGTAIPVIIGWFTARKDPAADKTSNPPPAVGSGAVLLVSAVAALMQTDCTPAQREEARYVTNEVLSRADEACVIANAFFPDSKVGEVCRLEGPKLELAKRLLASTRAAGAARPRSSPVRCAELDGAVACTASASDDAGAQ